jgi:hypothetical protein
MLKVTQQRYMYANFLMSDNSRSITQSFAVTTSWNRIELTFAADTSDPLDDDNGNSLK